MIRLNIAAILIVAYLAIFLECSFDGFRRWLGVQLDLLPVLIVYCGLTADLVSVTLLAVLGGLCFDSLSANPLGVSVLPLWIVGFLICQFREFIVRDHILAQFIIGGVASLVVPGLTLFLLSIFIPFKAATLSNPGVQANWMLDASFGPEGLGLATPIFRWSFMWQAAIMASACGALTPIVFRFFDFLNRTFCYPIHSESSFRPDREIKRGRSI